MLGLKEVDTTKTTDIYDSYKKFQLSENEREEKLLQRIQAGNEKRLGWCKKADGTVRTVMTQQNAIN